jgi:hypothetical protein
MKIKEIIEKVNKSFENHEGNSQDTYGVKIKLPEEMSYMNLALDLIEEGYSVMIIEEAGQMTATVFKKFNAYAEWFKKYDND